MEGRVDKVASSWNEIYEMVKKEKRLTEYLETNHDLNLNEKGKRRTALYNVRRNIYEQSRLIREIL